MRLAVVTVVLLGSGAAGAAAGRLDIAVGKAVFERLWVPAPSSTRAADGLGPLFATRSCAACHAGTDRVAFMPGRNGRVEQPGVVLRLGTPSGDPDPALGRELQSRAAPGLSGEGEIAVHWDPDAAGRLAPAWRIAGAAGSAAPGLRMSARLAPSLRGVGLLAAVPDTAILAAEDPDDRDGDGVRGRANRIAGPDGRIRIGRFGWKASETDLESQVASAFSLDLGLSTPLRPEPFGDCTAAEVDCRSAPQGAGPGEVEVPESLLAPLVGFLAALPPPPSLRGDEERGAKLFAAAGCAACHRPELPGPGGTPVRSYTDLLLHDLGPGLDDGLPEAGAASAEWRTSPLWGLSATLARGGGLMHDGRARDVKEAVLWHDGEAAGARRRFQALPAGDRAALLDFLGRL